MPEEDYKEIELTEDAKAELAEKDWDAMDETIEDQPPKPGAPASGYDEEPPQEEAEEEPPQGDEDEFELPNGEKVSRERLGELLTADKRFKDTQAAFTKAHQENARLYQELMAQRMLQPQFEQPTFTPEYPQQQQQEELQYATETEKRLGERLAEIEKRQAIRDHEARVAAQRENQRRADDIVSKFRTAHPDLDDNAVATVLQRANAANTYDLDLVYSGMRDYNTEIEAAKAAAIEEYQAKLKEKKKAALETSDGGVKPPEEFDPTKLTEEQLHAVMVAKLKESEGG